MNTVATQCSVALKEWAVTCQALREGRQIILLRKGGILDDEGVFALEHTAFWLQPTYEHQNESLVKPAHRDLFATVREAHRAGENRRFIALQSFAVVERVFTLTLEDEDKLHAARHIWSDDYLALRFGYKPERALLCVALRVYEEAAPHLVPMRDAFFGCRSWIDLEAPLDVGTARPVLDDTAFARYAAKLAETLES